MLFAKNVCQTVTEVNFRYFSHFFSVYLFCLQLFRVSQRFQIKHKVLHRFDTHIPI
jgi:hypothetical protein